MRASWTRPSPRFPSSSGTMGAEHLWLRAHADERGPTAADYERRDTITSLAMGSGSLVAPFVLPRLLGPITPGKGKYGKALVATAATADRGHHGRRPHRATSHRSTTNRPQPTPRTGHAGAAARVARKVASVGGVGCRRRPAGSRSRRRWRRARPRTACGSGGSCRDLGKRPGRARPRRSSVGTSSTTGTTGSCTRAGTCGRSTSCTTRASATTCRPRCANPSPTRSERSCRTACSSLLGVRPDLIGQARGINLLYQYWFHTDTIRTLGPFEKVLNTPSHHRVHHGRNQQYIDRNHGSILIIWDRLFGTFEPEAEPVVYGLTKNLDTFNPVPGRRPRALRDAARRRAVGELARPVVVRVPRSGLGLPATRRARVTTIHAPGFQGLVLRVRRGPRRRDASRRP